MYPQLCILTSQFQTLCQAHISIEIKILFFDLVTSMPKKYHKDPRSFISKCYSNYCFLSLIPCASSPVITISSTYTIISILFPWSWRKKTEWSFWERERTNFWVTWVTNANHQTMLLVSVSTHIRIFQFTHFLRSPLSNNFRRLLHIYLLIKNAMKERIRDI